MQDTDISAKPRDIMPAGALTLPARFYTDQRHFERELDLLFRKMWFCAGREEEIARPGQFVLRELPGENIVVTRDSTGAVRAFHNV